jgi:hypothetical protein
MLIEIHTGITRHLGAVSTVIAPGNVTAPVRHHIRHNGEDHVDL